MVLFHDAVPRYLALPNGDTYSVRLFDPITIPFVLGSDPFINITRPDVEIILFDTDLGIPSSSEPQYWIVSNYRGVVYIERALLSFAKQYSLRVIISGDVIAYTILNIIVDGKYVVPMHVV